MSKYVEIKNGTPVNQVIAMVKENPAGGIFRFSTSRQAGVFLMNFQRHTVDWVGLDKSINNPYEVLDFKYHGKCCVLITLREPTILPIMDALPQVKIAPNKFTDVAVAATVAGLTAFPQAPKKFVFKQKEK